MFEGQPKGLYALALANTGERFGYYTMIAVFALFLKANFGLTEGAAGIIYSSFLMMVYFLPLIGGMMADKFGFGKMVTTGIMIMFLGYLVLSIPMGGNSVALVAMIGALLLISFGTGLFKGNLQVMVGNLYDDSLYAAKRDAGFSIFYMAINIGAMFAPTAAIAIMGWGQRELGMTVEDSYHLAFAVACASLIMSIAIYYTFRGTFRHTEGDKKTTATAAAATVEELSPEETKKRIVALCLVFAVVIFFWMAFHQNGLSLTFFAEQFTDMNVVGGNCLLYNVLNLVMIILIVYGGFQLYEAKTAKARLIASGVIILSAAVLVLQYLGVAEKTMTIEAPIFQQFNPFYVVALTPVSLAIFGALSKKGKEPSAPRKIAYGMLVAAVAFFIMAMGSLGFNSPEVQKTLGAEGTFASPYLLIVTYLVLTFGELLLSPMGISFVSKVAPPKYKGMMMGGWFVATAVGNMLVSVGGLLWGGLPLWAVWTVFIALCLLSALFMFIMMKRLEEVAK